MGKTHILYIVRELMGQFPVIEEPVSFLRHPPPGPGMDLIYGDRGA